MNIKVILVIKNKEGEVLARLEPGTTQNLLRMAQFARNQNVRVKVRVTIRQSLNTVFPNVLQQEAVIRSGQW